MVLYRQANDGDTWGILSFSVAVESRHDGAWTLAKGRRLMMACMKDPSHHPSKLSPHPNMIDRVQRPNSSNHQLSQVLERFLVDWHTSTLDNFMRIRYFAKHEWISLQHVNPSSIGITITWKASVRLAAALRFTRGVWRLGTEISRFSRWSYSWTPKTRREGRTNQNNVEIPNLIEKEIPPSPLNFRTFNLVNEKEARLRYGTCIIECSLHLLILRYLPFPHNDLCRACLLLLMLLPLTFSVLVSLVVNPVSLSEKKKRNLFLAVKNVVCCPVHQ